MPLKSLGTARALSSTGTALLRDAVNSAGMGTSIPLSSAGSGHTHTPTVEDEDDVVKAMRGDAAEEITARLAGTHTDADTEEEEEKEEDDGDESTGRGRGAPPTYPELSSHFGILKRAADESGNGDATFYLSKAWMAIIAAHAAQRTRQADLRGFVATELVGTELLLLLFLTFSALVANPKKTTLYGGQSRSWSAEQGKKRK